MQNKYQEQVEIVLETEENTPFSLILWNDEVNTFDWVIKALIEICKFSFEQAEQSAYIIHYQGKYSVKQDTFEKLLPICDAILLRGIQATIEELA